MYWKEGSSKLALEEMKKVNMDDQV